MVETADLRHRRRNVSEQDQAELNRAYGKMAEICDYVFLKGYFSNGNLEIHKGKSLGGADYWNIVYKYQELHPERINREERSKPVVKKIIVKSGKTSEKLPEMRKPELRNWNIVYKYQKLPPEKSDMDGKPVSVVKKIFVKSGKTPEKLPEMRKPELKIGNGLIKGIAGDLIGELQHAYLEQFALNRNHDIRDRQNKDNEEVRLGLFIDTCLNPDSCQIMEKASFRSNSLKRDLALKYLFDRGILKEGFREILASQGEIRTREGFHVTQGVVAPPIVPNLSVGNLDMRITLNKYFYKIVFDPFN